MLNIGYFKGQPTDYVIKYSGGAITSEGPGLAFYFWQHKTQIVAVPTASADASFVFNEVAGNFQAVTIQGQLTYRIVNPKVVAERLNFSVDPVRRTFISKDPEQLAQRIINLVQMETRRQVLERPLENALRDTQAIAAGVLERVQKGNLLQNMGVELLNVYILAAKPTPEVGKALEAEHRETLLRRADQAIYARRAAAVEEERKIKENQLASDIALEEGRKKFIDLQGENATQEAENRGKALEKEASYQAKALSMQLDSYKGLDARTILALGLKDLGANASRVGNLNITTELLAGLLDAKNG